MLPGEQAPSPSPVQCPSVFSRHLGLLCKHSGSLGWFPFLSVCAYSLPAPLWLPYLANEHQVLLGLGFDLSQYTAWSMQGPWGQQLELGSLTHQGTRAWQCNTILALSSHMQLLSVLTYEFLLKLVPLLSLSLALPGSSPLISLCPCQKSTLFDLSLTAPPRCILSAGHFLLLLQLGSHLEATLDPQVAYPVFSSWAWGLFIFTSYCYTVSCVLFPGLLHL